MKQEVNVTVVKMTIDRNQVITLVPDKVIDIHTGQKCKLVLEEIKQQEDSHGKGVKGIPAETILV